MKARIKWVEGESAVLALDLKGVSVSSGAACASGSIEPSRILLAMGLSVREANASVRFSFGKTNTLDDVEHVVSLLPPMIEKLRAYSPKR